MRVNRDRWWPRRRLAPSEPASRPIDILRGVDLRIGAGRSVGVVGPSGSGKTSLLMLLAGLEQPSRGRVRIAGQDLASLDEDRRAQFRGRTVGIVFQSFHLIGTMTALENVAVPLELAGRPDAQDVAAASLRSVGLGHRMGHRPAELSGGEQQRVALARAFAPEPRLLLADEPTGNLDAATGARVAELMMAMQRERGTTLVLITHDPALASRCERTVSMADGMLSDAGT
ncbi:ABC transporter ATP-binding protein [Rhizosaccharibacter radicis]|uniref:ABC transporter ATP-binding protein n=1 Tax=Rhizosaccharibacter radicis TaxID=2782605 RepID=UPI003BF532A2